jgi:hypothetical protein
VDHRLPSRRRCRSGTSRPSPFPINDIKRYDVSGAFDDFHKYS